MSDLGARLKEARTTKGVALRDIAQATKISVVALEGLERNDYSRLPGGIFSRAFVRAYAEAVGLDAETAVNEFIVEFARHEKEEAERKAKKPEITADDREFVERQRRALRSLRVALAAAAMLAIAAVAYLVFVWWPAAKTAGPAAAAPHTTSAPASSSASASAVTTAGGPLGSHLR